MPGRHAMLWLQITPLPILPLHGSLDRNPAGLLALPQFGLSTVFVVSFVSATLLPLGSEPAVFGLVKLNPALFWPAVLVATAGNTLGGAISWWMGYGAERGTSGSPTKLGRACAGAGWLERFGPRRPAC
jgi:membrane protein YqaA with SNARE-associated domain